MGGKEPVRQLPTKAFLLKKLVLSLFKRSFDMKWLQNNNANVETVR